MTQKGNDLDALFADALKAVESIEKKTPEPATDLSEEIEIEFELEIEDPIEEYSESVQEAMELELAGFSDEEKGADEEEESRNFESELNSLQKEHQELDQKARKAMRGLRKYKQEAEKISRHNELLQRELSRLNGNAQQRSRKIDTLESRQESSREALLVANQRIDQLTEAVKRQEGMIERSRKLRQKEQADLKRFGAAPAIIKILPAIDSFELALTQSTDDADT
jgi:molecular chaperone GrpE (heat shock protein)